MWNKNITGLEQKGTFRSLNGAADENIFIGKASKAGFFCFFKVWRDMPYDAVLDYENILYRVEVKGSSTGNYDLTRGGRSGAQIDRNAAKRTRRISRDDCDFVVCVDSNNGDCFILPVDVIDTLERSKFTTSMLEPFKENWKLFMHSPQRLSDKQTRDGLCSLNLTELKAIALKIGATVPTTALKPAGLKEEITDKKKKYILAIWYKLCE